MEKEINEIASEKEIKNKFETKEIEKDNEFGGVKPVKKEYSPLDENSTCSVEDMKEISPKNKEFKKLEEPLSEGETPKEILTDNNRVLEATGIQGEIEIEQLKMEVIPTERDPLFNYFDISIPLIGKAFMQTNEKTPTKRKEDKPVSKRYDLAIERNKLRVLYDKEHGYDKLFAEESEKDKKKSAARKEYEDIQMAILITKITADVVKELNKDSVNQKKVGHYLKKFLHSGVTPASLLYVPYFVQIISFCRGNRVFCKALRMIADKCYRRCHAMFPVPPGYNFETVYTSEVGKFQPNLLKKFGKFQLTNGGISDISESSESESCSDDENNAE